MSAAQRPIVLATGGTGGHVFPAEALAEALAARGLPLALVTDRRARQWKGEGTQYEVHHIDAGSPSGSLLAKARGTVALARGFMQASALLRRLRPRLAVGFGGYASVPTLFAASMAGLPTVIHEQNAVLGRANRLLAGRVTCIATAFAQVRFAEGRKVHQVGNPVRAEIAALREQPYRAPEPGGPMHLLVTGGSQGAAVFSRIVPAAIAMLSEADRMRLHIVQQCRPEDLARVQQDYAALGVPAELAPFFSDIPARLAGAHLVVARAGASTVAELTVCGRPSILVPYPHATDDHQTANARAIDGVGAALLMADAAFTPQALADRLAVWLRDPAPLAGMAAAAAALGRPDAASRLADLVQATLSSAAAEGGAA